MSDPSKRCSTDASPLPHRSTSQVNACAAGSSADRMICERCGTAEMFRMHAVWRCPACGYKTDCCGW